MLHFRLPIIKQTLYIIFFLNFKRKYHIIHGYIRCSKLYVTKVDIEAQLLEVKISDPGFSRSYRKDE